MLCSKIYVCIFGADSQEGEANQIFASIFQCCSKKNVSANRRNDFTNRENRAEKHLNSFPQRSSLKQRLGKGDVLARLGRPMGTLMRGATRSQGFALRELRGMNRGFRVCGNDRRGFFRGVNQMRARGGVTKLRFRQGLRLQGGQLNNAGVLVSCGARNGLGLRGRGRGAGLGLRGRGGFRGRGMGKPKKIPTKEELDNQLDNYMSMTKSHLDAELDSYMAMAGSDYMD
ncbi:chromatin target of PRMT1 protein isoform X3 [Salmo salar]|uniref:Chromatin target of PRMT1 protein isoform X3 n=1 Tax=Salmo salar TaxID=8030 RepID=A0ABM3EVD5_SALSA|nr:chromatin target of PRMT1 protein-like isoform X3 [Salmo salar]